MTATSPPTDDAPPATEPSWMRPGGLGIRERRSWAMWQLATGMAAATIVGMIVGHTGATPSSASDLASASSRAAPVSPTTTPTTAAPTAAPITTTSTAVAGRSVTTTPRPLATGPETVLMPKTVGKGPATLAAFQAAGAWKIGWAFQCALAAGGGAPFSVTAGVEGQTPVALVNENGRALNGVASATTIGAIHLQVQTDPACQWAIKVTGIAG